MSITSIKIKHKNFDVDKIRADFPILKIKSNNNPLIFFDNGASSQKPKIVLDKIMEIYETKYANIHRGIYQLSQEATEAYEESRKKVQKFLNVESEKEIIFVRGATEGINLVAESFGFNNFKKNDEIILSQMEHHSNIVPWQLLRDKLGIKIKIAPINNNGEIKIDEFKKLIKPISTDELGQVAPRPMKGGLKTEYIQKTLNLEPPPLEESLTAIKDRLES